MDQSKIFSNYVIRYVDKDGNPTGLRTMKTLEHNATPTMLAHIIQQDVTLGLGYKPIKEVYGETDRTTNEGLQEHLNNMDNRLLFRELIEERLGRNEVFRALVGLEKKYKQTIECTFKIAQQAMDMYVIETLEHSIHHKGKYPSAEHLAKMIDYSEIIGLDVKALISKYGGFPLTQNQKETTSVAPAQTQLQIPAEPVKIPSNPNRQGLGKFLRGILKV